MKAFFKDNDKIIINSMDHSEALVGKTFLKDLQGKCLKAEQRNDINDDFDGLVLTISDLVHPTIDFKDLEVNFTIAYKAIDKTNTEISVKPVYKTDYILCDYDDTKVKALMELLSDMKFYDITFSIQDGFTFKTDQDIQFKYQIPSGMFLFHEPQTTNEFKSLPIELVINTDLCDRSDLEVSEDEQA